MGYICSMVPMLSDPKNRPWLCSLLIVASLIWGAYFFGSTFIAKEYKDVGTSSLRFMRWEVLSDMQKRDISACKDRCRPSGSEPLPKGIVVKASNLELQPLWGSIKHNKNSRAEKSLLVLAVGIKQKEIVDKIVKKFPQSIFVVMLFHYDGVVDDWKNLEWSKHAVHVSAVNQTKWWFAKRFLHPDIVFEYEYIFLWDEDLGVENFDPVGYLSIVKDEGLEISQPALDPVKSDVHHPITSRQSRSRVHRWVEMMAPVFSKAAWRCAWHMVQNDLIHAWGLDQLLGYCAQNATNVASEGKTASKSDTKASAGSRVVDNRMEVRQRSFIEMQIFRKRWKDAVEEDQCWVDPYRTPANRTPH
ncbi:hypothetical protein CDL15_Pgr003482 [Punica granatum]|uniref:Uncharacterized protein n=1 Tax=Punica granatum TaxID=22663 RepID=A0A218X3L3_PUNGR|nr:hypothetical protein CDL15_Pgr003482 [Punica granatum]